MSDDFILVGGSGSSYDFYGVEFDAGVDSVFSMMVMSDEGRFAKIYIQKNDKEELEKYRISPEKFRSEAVPYETWEE